MYAFARKLKYKNQWNYVVQRCEYFRCSNYQYYYTGQYLSTAPGSSSLAMRYVTNSSLLGRTSEGWCRRSSMMLDLSSRNYSERFFSSEGDGRNASEDKRVPNKDVVDFQNKKITKENTMDNGRRGDAHACLGEQDQMEWLKNEKITMDNKKESLFQTRRERYKSEFLRRITPWEKITVSWDNFPYYVKYVLSQTLYCCACTVVAWLYAGT